MLAIPIPMQEIEDDTSDDQKWKGIPYTLPEDQKHPSAKPIPVAQSSAQDAPSAPAAKAIPQAPATPASGSLEDLENMVGTLHPHAAVPIQTGVASLWSKAKNIHNPVLRVLGEIGAGGARVLDTVGSIVAPGITSAIPGTTLNQRAGQYREQKQDLENATIEEKRATSKEATARADAIAHPKPVADKPQTPQQVLAGIVAEDIDKNVSPADDPRVQQVSDTITGLAKEPVDKTPAPHVTYDAGIPVSVTDGKNVYDVNDPKLPDNLKPLVQAATRAHGQRLSEEAGKTAAANAEAERRFREHDAATTAATKSMKEAAPGVISLANRVKQLVAEQAKSLGPSGSRWSEFMAGKVGAPNPEFTKLRTDVGLLTTKLMRMHVGARGGELIMQHFKDLIDTGKQSPENLNAALDEIIQYAKDTQAESKGEQQQTAELTPPKTADAGMKWQHRTVDGKTEWRQVKQ